MNKEDVLKVALDDEEWHDCTLAAVSADPAPNTWSVTIADNGCSLFVTADGSVEHGDRELPAPKVGDVLRLWGKHANQLGGVVRGIALLDIAHPDPARPSLLHVKVHTLYRYRTCEEQDARDRKMVDDSNAKKKAKWHEKREETAARIAALPERFRERIEFFMRRPDWGWNYGFYELFCCEEATKIAKALNTREKIEAFSNMNASQQRELVPDLDPDHSSNTFGTAVQLAHCFVADPHRTMQMHGAMCPIMGCQEYGCWSTTLAEHIKDGVLVGTSID